MSNKITLYRAICPESGMDLTGLLTFQEMEDYIAGSDAVRHGITWDTVEIVRTFAVDEG